MIKANMGEIAVQGNKTILMAEFTQIIKAMAEKVLTEEEFKLCLTMASMTEEEIEGENERMEKILDDPAKVLAEVVARAMMRGMNDD